MHHVIALFAGCLLHPPANDPCQEARQAQYEFLRNHPASKIEWSDNGTVRLLKDITGLVLPSGAAGFQVDKAAPELLDKIGPALLARGTEELRVIQIRHHRLGREVNLRQFIRGREVVQGFVNILLNEQTNEITFFAAYFLPDRGLEHEPRLTAAEARTKVEAELREAPFYRDVKVTFHDAPPRLAYSFEVLGPGGNGLGGALVWVYAVEYPPAGGESQFGDLNADAATGRMTPRVNVLSHWNR